MPMYDIYHEPVKQALIKDGWIVTDDPYRIDYKGLRLYADLGAEKPIVAEKASQKIVVEVKVFGSASPLSELQKAVGQYSIYRLFIEKIDSERELFLAISQDTYQDFFLEPAVQEIVDVHKIHLVIFDPDTEEIIEWKR